MIALYRFVTMCAYLLALPFAWLASKMGSVKWRERYVWYDRGEPHDLWIHAASVGEVKMASYLIKYLWRSRPKLKIALTVVTDAGHKTAISEFGDGLTIRFMPIDTAVTVGRAYERIDPRLVAIAETEIWPHLILHAKSRNIPIVLFNGRMSAKAFARYHWIKKSLSRILECHEHFFFKSQDDAARYAEYGVDAGRSTVAGDMKFDAPLADRDPDKIARIRELAGAAKEEFLFVAGSTRPGEEEILVRMYQQAKSECARFRMIVAPRHVERAAEIRLLVTGAGLKCRLIGEPSVESGGDEIILVDKMGMLNDLYLAADLAFVGGTMVDIGGHNILEPVWAGTPVIYGQSIANVVEASAYIEKNQYGRKAKSVEELTLLVTEVCAGTLKFRIKTIDEYRHSATGLIGDYILKRLNNA